MASCTVCGKRAYSDYCVAHKPRKPIATHTRIKPATKPIKAHGKQAAKWSKTRQEWLRQNSSLMFTCYLCGKPLPRSELTLDHVIPRSRAPELRHDFTNLRPAHLLCNNTKGSRTLDKLQ